MIRAVDDRRPTPVGGGPNKLPAGQVLLDRWLVDRGGIRVRRAAFGSLDDAVVVEP
jgi:hypothetical protein